VKRIFVQNRFHSAAHKVDFAQRRVFVHVSIALCGLRLAVANKPFDHGQRRALGHRYAGGSMAQVMQTNLLMLSACANARPRFAEIDHPPLRTRAGKDERASSCAGSLIIKHRQRRVAQTNRLCARFAIWKRKQATLGVHPLSSLRKDFVEPSACQKQKPDRVGRAGRYFV
jgi:hypothetical protein